MTKQTYYPNTFQTPNVWIDKALSLLTPSEFACLMFATRHILGWQDRVARRQASISLSMFEGGFTDQHGQRYEGTGLNTTTIIKATQKLTEYGLLLAVGDPTAKGQCWELCFEIDWQPLEMRAATQKETIRERTRKARGSAEAKRRSIQQTSGLADRGVVYPIEEGWSIQQTTSGLADRGNQTHVQTHVQTHTETPTGDDENTPLNPEEWKALREAVQRALRLGEKAHPLISKYAQFLAGTTPERTKKGAANTTWYEYRIVPGMSEAEVRAWRSWLTDEYPEMEPLRKPETLYDYVHRFRSAPGHDRFVERAMLMVHVQAGADLPTGEGVAAIPSGKATGETFDVTAQLAALAAQLSGGGQ